MRYQLNNYYERKPDFFQKRYSINSINNDDRNKDFLDIYAKESYDFNLFESSESEMNKRKKIYQKNIPKKLDS